MIVRVWHGYTSPENGDAYEALLKSEIFGGIELKAIEGFKGIDLLRPLRSSDPIEALHAEFRKHVPVLNEDREMAPDLNAARHFLDDMDPFLEELL